MKSTIWKRFGSILMVLIMVFTIIPDIGVTVKAQPRENETAQGQDNTYPISVTTAEGYAYASIKNEDGTTERINRAAPGEKIYLEFSDVNTTPRTGFVRWVDDNGNLTDLTNETSYDDCSFTMPEGEAKIHAELAQNCPTVTVENGGIKVRSEERDYYYRVLSSPSVTAGREIYLAFDESKTPKNKVFKKWYVKSGNVELNNPTSKHHCMITVPNEDVEIGVIYDEENIEGTYPISVTATEGHPRAVVKNEDGTIKQVKRAAPGEKIHLEFSDYDMASGTGFARWVDDNGNLTDLTNETSYYGCSFTMPEGEVKIHAELAQNCPTVTVENGRIMVHSEEGDFYILNSSSVIAGREIYLDFDESKTPENKIFKKWYVKSGNVELSDPTSMSHCMLTVPNEDVEIGVIYESTEGTYPISVTTEEGYSYAEVINEDGTRKRVNRAAPGEKIYLCFSDYNMTSRTGFARWVDDNGNLTDLTNETSYYDCSFTMPEGEVKIHAELAQNCPTVTVENGGIKVQAGERKFYILNSSSVTAGREIYLNFDESKTPENKVFKKWYVKSGNVELSDPTSKHHCMLTVPNEDVEIGVIYEAEAGWQSDNVGWWYNDENGNYVTGWKYIDSKWYYFASNGYMQTGWVSVNNHWYYMDQWGAMCNGWVAVDGHWYYMDQWGAMCTGWVSVNGYWYYMDQWGAMQTGWVSVNGYWYYMDQWGAMQTGWVSVNGYWYYMDQWGAMQTGWVSVNGHWYYMDQWGAMQTGWVLVGSDWYYMNTDGSMATSQWIDGYYVDASGKME